MAAPTGKSVVSVLSGAPNADPAVSTANTQALIDALNPQAGTSINIISMSNCAFVDSGGAQNLYWVTVIVQYIAA